MIRELPTEVTTIAEILKQAGYATAHFGKWHVGRTDPRAHGFDESDGATSNGGPENSRNPNPKQAYGMTERGINFIERQTKAVKPFYLQLSHYGGRSQADAKPETFERVLQLGLGRNERNPAAAAVALDMDTTIGMVLDKLNQLGIAEDTYVIYTADHGTPGRNGPLQGGKGGLWDGGIRIPLFVRGPVAKSGSHSRVRITGADLVPTIADLAGVLDSLPKKVEGGSLKQVLVDPDQGSVKRPREELVFHFPHYDKDRLGPVSAIILGDFKLVRIYEQDRHLLFDLSNDIGERNNLAAAMPEKVSMMDARLTEYLAAVQADMPTIRKGATATESPTDERRTPRRRRDALLTAIDRDADGRLSKQELDKVPELLRSLDEASTSARQEKSDRNRESRSADRQRRLKRQNGRRGRRRLFDVIDVDRNGQLSREEMDSAVAVLMRLDSNKDGTLTAEELQMGKGR